MKVIKKSNDIYNKIYKDLTEVSKDYGWEITKKGILINRTQHFENWCLFYDESCAITLFIYNMELKDKLLEVCSKYKNDIDYVYIRDC